jgi:hypothetical protein
VFPSRYISSCLHKGSFEVVSSRERGGGGDRINDRLREIKENAVTSVGAKTSGIVHGSQEVGRKTSSQVRGTLSLVRINEEPPGKNSSGSGL